ncbi:MAG: hypothetical protein Q8Q02_13915 [Nocardioides sp.]|nr:hypothetical protein [Nocardioides sp.]
MVREHRSRRGPADENVQFIAYWEVEAENTPLDDVEVDSCQLCLGPSPLSQLHIDEPFHVRQGKPYMFAQSWKVCSECRDLVERDDRTSLLARTWDKGDHAAQLVDAMCAKAHFVIE